MSRKNQRIMSRNKIHKRALIMLSRPQPQGLSFLFIFLIGNVHDIYPLEIKQQQRNMFWKYRYFLFTMDTGMKDKEHSQKTTQNLRALSTTQNQYLSVKLSHHSHTKRRNISDTIRLIVRFRVDYHKQPPSQSLEFIKPPGANTSSCFI